MPHLRYLAALLGRFRVTVAMAALLFGTVPLIFRWQYRHPNGTGIRYGEALHHVYFLMFGQPSLPYVPNPLLETLNILLPPFGIAVIVDGVVRFAYLFFAKHRSDKVWIEVMSRSMQDHVIVCGAGRVGYRVVAQLLALGRDVVVIEKNAEGAFVSVLRDQQVPVLIDDIKSPQCLPRTNVERAVAIVCATDDDLANLNVALDARKLHPDIRVVMRLFDDDLVAKVRHAFRAEALSTSALAAPALAFAALDPRIRHSFQIGAHLMVVSDFVVSKGLVALTVDEIHRRFSALALALRREGEDRVHPPGDLEIQEGDVLTMQASFPAYVSLRAFTGEERAPVSLH